MRMEESGLDGQRGDRQRDEASRGVSAGGEKRWREEKRRGSGRWREKGRGRGRGERERWDEKRKKKKRGGEIW